MMAQPLWPIGAPPAKQTTIFCPHCQKASLMIRRQCRATDVLCSGCQRQFSVGELAGLLDEDSFGQLAQLVGDHLADRV